MEWIESKSLERRLWRYFYSKKQVQSDISRTFLWLKKFHKHNELEKKILDTKFYKNSLNHTIKTHEDSNLISNNETFKLGRLYLDKLSEEYNDFETYHAKLHGDFTPTNVLIDDDKVTGIDLFGNQHLPVEIDIALQFSYISIEYPNMLTRSDFKLPPEEWPLLRVVLDAYGYSKDERQLKFFLYVFLYQLLRRWTIINYRNLSQKTPWLERRRLRNTEMIVENLCLALRKMA